MDFIALKVRPHFYLFRRNKKGTNASSKGAKFCSLMIFKILPFDVMLETVLNTRGYSKKIQRIALSSKLIHPAKTSEISLAHLSLTLLQIRQYSCVKIRP